MEKEIVILGLHTGPFCIWMRVHTDEFKRTKQNIREATVILPILRVAIGDKMKELMNKIMMTIAMVLFIAPVAVGTIHAVVAEKEASVLVSSIEEIIVENKDNAVAIEDSKYYENMERNQFYVQSAVRKSNVAPIATIDHVNDNGEEFTNAVYLTEYNGEYGLMIIQDIANNAVEDTGVLLINYNTDITTLAKYAAYYGYGCVQAI